MFNLYEWLEYSVKDEKCYYYTCRSFGTTIVIEKTFVSIGFINWEKISVNIKYLLKFNYCLH